MTSHKSNALDAEFTFWDLADPEEAAVAARDLYGPAAATAAASAAFTARYGGREADFRFWFQVFVKLSADDERAW
ncbi:hypothetical protein [Chelativorans salis]|uniref:Uncharacterized protein n=1 Tax=Chelativorans salis TaxID=2978478 RepID=A0ABT2LJF8_9HYPH|nr:hypothetical protein [Chelativorans sp. EGI FJ00035]MCT7374725.1 hypothetical protein [Chelativorans sp. EGI FJ00035]